MPKNTVAKLTLEYTALTVLVALLACILLASPVLAYDSGNYTSVDIVFSDNLTIAGDNLSLEIVGLDGMVDDAVEEMLESAYAKLLLVFVYLILFSLALLGYWKMDRVMLLIAGLGFALYGFTLWGTLWWLSVLTVIAGVYLVFKAFTDKRRAE
ncbi:hypothetical protein M0R72_21640 [Candidatus Pacearchaeota archaeon]|jgi:small-conductance mechanosensitive channel|nr:hypothetical protein [Candidatus Pacearchaeota archaeon]